MQNRRSVIGLVGVVLLAGCVPAAAPSPAVISSAAPPWPAPRDGVSYIDAAGMPRLPYNDTDDPHTFTMTITRNGQPVHVAAHIGMDRVRAWQAPVHTHDTSGVVWLEGNGNRDVTLAQFFEVWGVRFTSSCLGDVCGTLTVTADGQPVADPGSFVLRNVRRELAVAVTG